MRRNALMLRLWVGLVSALPATVATQAQELTEILSSCTQPSYCNIPGPISGITEVFSGYSGRVVVGTSSGALRWWFTTYYFSPLGGSLEGVDLTRGVGIGSVHIVAARADGAFLGTWLDLPTNVGQLSPPADLGAIRRISAGLQHTVLVQSDGAIRCFGGNTSGECDAPRGADFVDVHSKFQHSAARRADGSVVCWGSNWAGQCNPPVGLPSVRQVVAGNTNTLALLEDGTVRQWGYGYALPTSLPLLEKIDASGTHAVGRTASGDVVCWGDDGVGQCGGSGNGFTRRRPAALAPAVSIAAADGVTATVDADGRYVAWGTDAGGSCTLPQAIQPLRGYDISGGQPFWLKADGAVVARPGAGADGMRVSAEGLRFNEVLAGAAWPAALTCEGELKIWSSTINAVFPGSARFVRKAAVGYYHVVAIDRASKLRYWTSVAQPTWSTMPTGVASVADVAAGNYYSMALDSRGKVFVWGDNSGQVCDVPADLPAARGIAAGWLSALALLDDGTVRSWGTNNGYAEQTPSGVGPVSRLFASGDTRVAQRTNGTWCKWNRWGNTLQWEGARVWATFEGELYSQVPSVDLSTPVLPAIAFGSPIEHTFVVPRRAANDVQLQISTVADLSLSTEFASVRLDGVPFTNIFVADGRDCPEDPDIAYLVIPRSTFNGLVEDGRLTVRIDGSAGVNGTQCALGLTRIRLYYDAEVVDCNGNGVSDAVDVASRAFDDCDRNGVPDSCDFAAGTVVDFDANGVIDACEPDCNDNEIPDAFEVTTGLLTDCNGNLIPDTCDSALGEQDKDVDGRLDECELARGDFDLSGFIDGADLGALLSLWGFPNPPYGDLDRDGSVAGGDLAILLNSWGAMK